MVRRGVVALVVLAVVGLGACGGDDGGASDAAASGASTTEHTDAVEPTSTTTAVPALPEHVCDTVPPPSVVGEVLSDGPLERQDFEISSIARECRVSAPGAIDLVDFAVWTAEIRDGTPQAGGAEATFLGNVQADFDGPPEEVAPGVSVATLSTGVTAGETWTSAIAWTVDGSTGLVRSTTLDIAGAEAPTRAHAAELLGAWTDPVG